MRLSCLLVCALLVFLALPLGGPVPAVSAQAAEATLTVLNGTVTVYVGTSGEARAATSGDVVVAGDRVLTADPGEALLTFFDGSEQELGANTEVLLQALGDTSGGGLLIQIAQASGATVNRVTELGEDSSYQLQTPNTTAVVRGTEFNTSITLDPETRRVVSEDFSVAEGTVEVRIGQQVRTLNPGDQLRIVSAADGGIETVGSAPVVESDGVPSGEAGGVLVGWGDTGFGKLGNGTNEFTLVPVPVLALSKVIDFSAGYFHSLAITEGGGLWSWGGNTDGQLGLGDLEERSVSVPTRLSGFTASYGVSAGDAHSLVVGSDGAVWAWGSNYFGQRGDGTTTCSTECDVSHPVQVIGLVDVAKVAAGSQHSLALKTDGTVWAWGLNLAGQVGDGTSNNVRTVPVQVVGLSDVIAIAAADSHSLALKKDGTVWAWGDSDLGQLGIGVTSEDTSVPVQVPGLSDIADVKADSFGSLALRKDGTVWAWGRNDWGQLGIGEESADGCQCFGTPVQVVGLTDARAIAAGGAHNVAVRGDDTVWAWGANYTGQLGNDTLQDSSVPVQVLGLHGVTVLDAGESHTLAYRP